MEKTWMPKVAGILNIVAGSFGVFFSLMMALWFAAFSCFLPMCTIPMCPAEFDDFPMSFMAIFMIPWAVFMLATGIMAIVGGIYALQRKKWGVALAGSITALFGSSALGVAAIIFTALSKSEFE